MWWILGIIVVMILLTLAVVVLHTMDCVDRFANGNIAARGPWSQGDKQGHWTFWREDGSKECEGEYINGFETGSWTFYHLNGRPCARGELDDWRRQGPWDFWDEVGRPLDEDTFLERFSDSGGASLPNRDSIEPTESPSHA